MRKVWFGRAECCGAAVRYYLLVEECGDQEERYGLQVRYRGETETVPGITSSQRQIQSLLELLVRGRVTPVTVREVVDDWLNGGQEENREQADGTCNFRQTSI